MSNNIKAVVFDMDGVLVDATEWHYLAFNAALRDYGYNISVDEHKNIFDGLPTRKKLEILSEKYNLPQKLHADINRLKQEYTINYIEQMCKPVEIHQTALQTLKEQGYRVGLASNSIKSTVDLILEKANISHHFDVILSSSDVINPKPHPEIYQKAISLLNEAPHTTLVVEDNKHGIEAAQAAGANVLVVKTVKDVNLSNIQSHINMLNMKGLLQ